MKCFFIILIGVKLIWIKHRKTLLEVGQFPAWLRKVNFPCDWRWITSGDVPTIWNHCCSYENKSTVLTYWSIEVTIKTVKYILPYKWENGLTHIIMMIFFWCGKLIWTLLKCIPKYNYKACAIPYCDGRFFLVWEISMSYIKDIGLNNCL